MERFIPTADDPTRYREVKEPARQRSLEYRLVHDAMLQTGFRSSLSSWHVQGMYIITPSGRMIAGGNGVVNPDSALDDMRRGLEIYARMPRSERLLARAPNPSSDRMAPERSRPRPPAGGLNLRSVARNLDRDAVAERCDVTPELYQIDRLWYTREEARQFLPSPLQPGMKKEVTGPVLDGLVRLYLISHLGSGPYWEASEVKERRLTTEVTEVTGRSVSLCLRGRAAADATGNPFNWKSYRPELLGYATYDTGTQSFTRFDLLALGPHKLADTWTRPGGPKFMPFGILFTLNGANANDRQPPLLLPQYGWVGLQARP